MIDYSIHLSAFILWNKTSTSWHIEFLTRIYINPPFIQCIGGRIMYGGYSSVSAYLNIPSFLTKRIPVNNKPLTYINLQLSCQVKKTL